MPLTHCEICNELLKDCKCKSSAADFIESQPKKVIKSVIKTIKKWGKNR